MILTDREIQIALESKAIAIEPAPAAQAYASTSVDLTLDPVIQIYRKQPNGVRTVIEPASSGFNALSVINVLTEKVEVSLTAGYDIEPQQFLLAWTRETVDLRSTSRIAARVEGKSSLARFGVGVHITAPTIHSGFRGKIQLEVYNHGSLPVKLVPGQRICQLIFEQTLGVPNSGYKGQFLGQST